MEVGTSPLHWESLKGDQAQRDERASRIEVTRLDYLASGETIEPRYGDPRALRAALDETSTEKRDFRLFVVEDLSRDLIELLGARYDIEPHFFREHIFSHPWYGNSDRWTNLPQFHALAQKQRWVQLRFATARYFRTSLSCFEAFQEAEQFNVSRRMADDDNSRGLWDQSDAKVGITRQRASFWLSHDDQKEERVGKSICLIPWFSL